MLPSNQFDASRLLHNHIRNALRYPPCTMEWTRCRCLSLK